EPIWAQPPPPQPSFQTADPFLDAASREAVAAAAAAAAAAATATATSTTTNLNTCPTVAARRTENISDVSMPDYNSFRGARDSRDTSSGQTCSSMKSVMYHRKEASQASVKQQAGLDDPEYNSLIDAIKGKEAREQQQQKQQQKLPKRSSRQRKSQQTRDSSRSAASGTIPVTAPASALAPASAPVPAPAPAAVPAPIPAPAAVTVLPESTPTALTIASSVSKSPSSVLAVAGSAASRKASHAGALLELPGSKTNSRNPSAASSGRSLGGRSSGIGMDRDHPLILDDMDDEDAEEADYDDDDVDDDADEDDDGFESPILPSKLLTPSGGSDYLWSKKEGRKSTRQRRKFTNGGNHGTGGGGGGGGGGATTSTYSAYSASSSDVNASLFRDPDLSSAKPRAAITASITDTPPPPSSSDSTGAFRTVAAAAGAGGDNTKRKRSSQVSPLSQLGQTPNDNDTSALGLSSDDSVIREASPNKKKVLRLVDPDGEDQENLGDGEFEMLLGSEGRLAAVAAAAAAGLGTDGASAVGEIEDK
ncbi:hypothetical protein KEM54_003277, partial [Ascosphaera aggregata]